MKISTYRNSSENSDGDINFYDYDYSHALSHCAFGKFINTLLVFFPIWNENNEFSYPVKHNNPFPVVLNTKFEGEKVKSLSHSHWLAQEQNIHLKWSEILSPIFLNTHHGSFTKICQELNFLCFIVNFSKEQKYNLKSALCNIFNKKSSAPFRSNEQMPLFSKLSNNSNTTQNSFNRVVLNLTNLPKKNPYHYLLTKVNEQSNELGQGGLLLLLTNQNLFVPSQAAKLEQTLKHFSVEAKFSFEQVHGKGELPSQIYVLKKRKYANRNYEEATLLNKQESCLNFKWSGELSQFSQFVEIEKGLINFFQKKSSKKTSIFHGQISNNLSFEFHRDAIIEGKLLNSNGDQSNITHPNFFRKIVHSCSPLEQFFIIENIEKKQESLTSDFLGVSINNQQQFDYILTIDHRNPTQIKADISPASTLNGLKEKNGVAYFQYFALTPKLNRLNINLFREYFNSQLGQQIIQISLQGGTRKMKSKVDTILIPKSFASTEKIQSIEEFQQFSFLSYEKTLEILKIDPKTLQSQIDHFFNTIQSLEKNHIWTSLSLVSQVKHNLEQVDTVNKDEMTYNEIFQNPVVLNPLISLKSYPLYPNEDIYIDYSLKEKEQIHLHLDKVELIKNGNEISLGLYNEDQLILTLHGEEYHLNFIKFILQSTYGYPIDRILSNLKIPKRSELKEILSQFSKQTDLINEFKKKCQKVIEQLMLAQV